MVEKHFMRERKKTRRNIKHVIPSINPCPDDIFVTDLRKYYSFSSLLPTRRISLLSFSFFLILFFNQRFRWRLCYSTPLLTIRRQASISPTILDPSRIFPVNRDLDHLDLSPSDTPQFRRSGNVSFLFGYNEKWPLCTPYVRFFVLSFVFLHQ